MTVAETIRVECSWCDAVLVDGPDDARVSHTICEPCMDRELLAAGLLAEAEAA